MSSNESISQSPSPGSQQHQQEGDGDNTIDYAADHFQNEQHGLPQLQQHGDLTVLTWNILASCYLFPHRLHWLDPQYHDFLTSRLPRFLSIIDNSGADVLCLQEVDQIEHITKGLLALGFDVVYRQRGTYTRKAADIVDQTALLATATTQELLLQIDGSSPTTPLETGIDTTTTTTTTINTTDAVSTYHSQNDQPSQQESQNDKQQQRQVKKQQQQQQVSKKNKPLPLIQFNNTMLFSPDSARQVQYDQFTHYLQSSPIDSTVLLSHIITQTAQQYSTQIDKFLPFNNEQKQQSIIGPNPSQMSPMPLFVSPTDAFNARLQNPVDFTPLFNHLQFPQYDPLRKIAHLSHEKHLLHSTDAELAPNHQLSSQEELYQEYRNNPLISGLMQHRPKQDGLIVAWKSKKFALSYLPLEVDLNILGYNAIYTHNRGNSNINQRQQPQQQQQQQSMSNNGKENADDDNINEKFIPAIDALSLTPTAHIKLQSQQFNTTLQQVSVNARLLRDNISLVVALHPIDQTTQQINDNKTILVGNSYFFFSPLYEDVKIMQALFTNRILNQFQRYILQQVKDKRPRQCGDRDDVENDHQIVTFACGDFNATPSSAAIRVVFGDILSSIDSIDISHPDHDKLVEESQKDLAMTPQEAKQQKQLRFMKMKQKKLMKSLKHDSKQDQPQQCCDDNGNNSNDTNESNNDDDGEVVLETDATTSTTNNNDFVNENEPIGHNGNKRGKSTILTVLNEQIVIPIITKGQEVSNIKLDLRLALERVKYALTHQVAHDNYIRSLAFGGYRNYDHIIASNSNTVNKLTSAATSDNNKPTDGSHLFQQQQPEVLNEQQQQPEQELATTIPQQLPNQPQEANVLLPVVWEHYLRYGQASQTHNPTPQSQLPPTLCTTNCPHHTSTTLLQPLLTNNRLPLPCSLPIPPVLLVGDMIALARTMRGLGVDAVQALVQPNVGFFPNSVNSLDPYIKQLDAKVVFNQLESHHRTIININKEPNNRDVAVQIDGYDEITTLSQLDTELTRLRDIIDQKLPPFGNIHFRMSETDKNKTPIVYQQMVSYAFFTKRIIITAIPALVTYYQSLLKSTQNLPKFHDTNPFIAPPGLRHTLNPDQLPLIVYLPPVQSSYFNDKDSVDDYFLQQFTSLQQYFIDNKALYATPTTVTPTTIDINPTPLLPSQYSIIPPAFAARHNISYIKKPKSLSSALVTTHVPAPLITSPTPTATNTDITTTIIQNDLNFNIPVSTTITPIDLFHPTFNPRPVQALYSRLLSLHTATTSLKTPQVVLKSKTSNENIPADSALDDEFIDLTKPNRNNIRLCALFSIIQGGIDVSAMLTRCTHCNELIPLQRRGCGKGDHCSNPQQKPTMNKGEFVEKCEELRCMYCVEHFVGTYTTLFPSFIQSTYFAKNNLLSNVTQINAFKRVVLNSFITQQLQPPVHLIDDNTTPTSTTSATTETKSIQYSSPFNRTQITLKDLDLFYLSKSAKQSTTLLEYNHDVFLSIHNLDVSLFSQQQGNIDHNGTPLLQYECNKLALYIEGEPLLKNNNNDDDNNSKTTTTPTNTNSFENVAISSITTRGVMLHWLVGSLGAATLMLSHVDFLVRYLPSNNLQLVFSMDNVDSVTSLRKVQNEYNKTNGVLIDENGDSDEDDDGDDPKIEFTGDGNDQNDADADKPKLLRLERRKAWRKERLLREQLEMESMSETQLSQKQRVRLANQIFDGDNGSGDDHDNDQVVVNDAKNKNVNNNNNNNNNGASSVNKKSYFINKVILDDDINDKKQQSLSSKAEKVKYHDPDAKKASKKQSNNDENASDYNEDDNDDDDDDNGDDDGDDDSFDIHALSPPLPPPPSNTKLYVTDGLYRLAKTLRTIGIDTAYGFPPSQTKQTLTQKIQAIFDICHAEERILVTNSRSILERRDCPPYILLPTTLPEGLTVQTITPLALPQLNEGGEPSYTKQQRQQAQPTTLQDGETTPTTTAAPSITTMSTSQPQEQQPKAVWSYKFGNQGYIRYDNDTNSKVEEAYQKFFSQGKAADLSKIWINPSPNRIYIVDFITMSQRNNKTDFLRKIIRLEQSQSDGKGNNDGENGSFLDQRGAVTNENMEPIMPSINLSDYHIYLIKTHLKFNFVPTHMYIRCTLCNGTFKSLSIYDIRQLTFLPSSIKTGRNKRDKKKLDFYQCCSCQQIYWWGTKSANVKDRLTSFLDNSSTLTITLTAPAVPTTTTSTILENQGDIVALSEIALNTTTTSAKVVDLDIALPPTTPQVFTQHEYRISANQPAIIGGVIDNDHINMSTIGETDPNNANNVIIPPSVNNNGFNSKPQLKGYWEAIFRAGRCTSIVLNEKQSTVVTNITNKKNNNNSNNHHLHSVDVTYQGGSIITCLQHPLLFGLFINHLVVVADFNDVCMTPNGDKPAFLSPIQRDLMGSSTSYRDMISAKVFAKTELSFSSVFSFNRHDINKLLSPSPPQQQQSLLDLQMEPTVKTKYQHSLFNPIFSNAANDYQGCLDYICVTQSSLQPAKPFQLQNAFKWAITLASCGNGSINASNHNNLSCPCVLNLKHLINIYQTNENDQQANSNLAWIDECVQTTTPQPTSLLPGFDPSNIPSDESTCGSPSTPSTNNTDTNNNISDELSLDVTQTTPLPPSSTGINSVELVNDNSGNVNVLSPTTPSQRELSPNLIIENANLVMCPNALQFFFRKGFGEFMPFINQLNNNVENGHKNPLMMQLTHPPFPNRLNPSDHIPIVASFDFNGF